MDWIMIGFVVLVAFAALYLLGSINILVQLATQINRNLYEINAHLERIKGSTSATSHYLMKREGERDVERGHQ